MLKYTTPSWGQHLTHILIYVTFLHSLAIVGLLGFHLRVFYPLGFRSRYIHPTGHSSHGGIHFMGHTPLGGFILGQFVQGGVIPGVLSPGEARPLKIASIGNLYV